MKVIFRRALLLLMLCCILFCVSLVVYAAEAAPKGTIYELPEDSQYSTIEDHEVQRFMYGRKSLGTLSVAGPIGKESTYKGVTAYSVTAPITFGYDYDGSFQTDDKDNWNIESDNGKTVNGIEVSKKVRSGVVIIQKSPDGKNWENAVAPINDFFTKNSNGDDCLYTTLDEDTMNGMFYRITVAYTMLRRTETGSFAWVIPVDQFEHKECVEVYEFYVESDKDYITINDLVDRYQLQNNATTTNGFYIQKNGSTDVVTVKRNNETTTIANNYDYFIKPGKYTVEVKTTLGQKYSYTINVDDGLAFSALSPNVYESKKNTGFPTETLLNEKTVFGQDSLTTLSLARVAGTKLSSAERNGVDAYGITGQSVSLFLKLRASGDDIGNGWNIEYDKWGKKNKETINGIMTGEIGKGALIVQTSSDGKNWSDVDKGRYADGLYTTDFATHYAVDENVLIYTPSGNDVLNGIYIRVFFAYQIRNEEKEYRDYLEKYEFYLCSNELNAVTIHNLSTEGMVEEVMGDADENTVSLYKTAETMLSGACTTTGFTIDKSLNPTVTYRVKRDGVTITVPRDEKFTQTGKYDIQITSAVGDHKDIVIYVDRNTDETAMELYFGEGFLSGKRIFAEGEYPVYEGGEVQYNIAAVSESYLPISGTITNQTTGAEIKIENNRLAKSGVISEAGSYVAAFTTNPNYEDDDASGDTRVFVFRFTIIANGTAPGPVVNQQNLKEYAKTSVTDSYPMYYGLIYHSAAAGNIKLAFATKEAAVEYAYNYEKGTVEIQDDGSFRYTGSFVLTDKTKFNSAWDLTDAMYYFAEQAVQELYFDMSDQYTYRTLKESVIESTNNLRTLELKDTVTIFGDGQRDVLCTHESLPIISPKPFAYLNPGINGKVESGALDFEFIKDKYGCDSDTVVVIDPAGKEYNIEYNLGVGQQLLDAGCPSGIVTVRERTVYGDEATYQAVYIAEGVNTTSIMLDYYADGTQDTIQYTQDDNGTSITVDAFEINSITDPLDPYVLVTVSDASNSYHYVADQMTTGAWTTPGEYEIAVTNRLGHRYSINVIVADSGYSSLVFTGVGTESTKAIVTQYGEEHIALPDIQRYGYTLSGYTDENGQLYTDEIAKIMFKGTLSLNAVWEAKKCNIHFQDEIGNSLADTVTVDFGSIYELPIPDLGDVEFLGWTIDGEDLDASAITIDSEDDIVLVASTRTMSSDLKEDTDNVKNMNLGLVAGSAIAFVVLLVIIHRVRKALQCRNTKNRQGSEESDGFTGGDN